MSTSLLWLRRDLRAHFDQTATLVEEMERLARRYFCSTLVILLRLREEGLLPRRGFSAFHAAEVERLQHLIEATASSDGGMFYNNQPFRVGRALSRAIIRDTRRGNTPMAEALRLLAFSSVPMFDTYAGILMDA